MATEDFTMYAYTASDLKKGGAHIKKLAKTYAESTPGLTADTLAYQLVNSYNKMGHVCVCAIAISTLIPLTSPQEESVHWANNPISDTVWQTCVKDIYHDHKRFAALRLSNPATAANDISAAPEAVAAVHRCYKHVLNYARVRPFQRDAHLLVPVTESYFLGQANPVVAPAPRSQSTGASYNTAGTGSAGWAGSDATRRAAKRPRLVEDIDDTVRQCFSSALFAVRSLTWKTQAIAPVTMSNEITFRFANNRPQDETSVAFLRKCFCSKDCLAYYS